MTVAEWRLDFSAADGTHGSVHLEIPGRGEGPARYEAVLAGPGLGPGVVVVRDDDVPPPRGTLVEVRAEGLWAEVVCEVPGAHWAFGLEAFGLRYETEAEAAAGGPGERLAVGLDLEWETPDRVHGEILVGRARVELDARGTLVLRPAR